MTTKLEATEILTLTSVKSLHQELLGLPWTPLTHIDYIHNRHEIFSSSYNRHTNNFLINRNNIFKNKSTIDHSSFREIASKYPKSTISSLYPFGTTSNENWVSRLFREESWDQLALDENSMTWIIVHYNYLLESFECLY